MFARIPPLARFAVAALLTIAAGLGTESVLGNGREASSCADLRATITTERQTPEAAEFQRWMDECVAWPARDDL
jgi:hypothetical protein